MKNNSLIKLLPPDPRYNLRGIYYLKNIQNGYKETTTTLEHNQTNVSLSSLPIKGDTLSKLGVRVLPKRRLCLAGRMLRGIFMPKSLFGRFKIIKRFLDWYSPCIKVREHSYDVDAKCFNRRENMFLTTYLKSLKYCWQLMPTKEHFIACKEWSLGIFLFQ